MGISNRLFFCVASILFFLVPGLGFASSLGWGLSAGVYQNNLLDLTKDKTGKADTWGETYLPLGLQYSFDVMTDWRFSPSLHLTHITSTVAPNETPEKGAVKNILLLNLPLVTSLASWADAKMGFGYQRYEIKGKGGTVELSNGTGTSTFYKPKKDQVSEIVYLLLGMGFPLDGWQVDFDVLVSGAASEERRSYSAYLYVTLPFGDGL
jgi:hypothetical protein